MSEVKTGYVHKCGKRVRSWNRRWFVLKTNGYLTYYEHSDCKNEKGKIDIVETEKIVPYKESPRQEKLPSNLSEENAFAIITKDRTFVCVCEVGGQHVGWIEALNKVRLASTLEYPSPTNPKEEAQEPELPEKAPLPQPEQSTKHQQEQDLTAPTFQPPPSYSASTATPVAAAAPMPPYPQPSQGAPPQPPMPYGASLQPYPQYPVGAPPRQSGSFSQPSQPQYPVGAPPRHSGSFSQPPQPQYPPRPQYAPQPQYAPRPHYPPQPQYAPRPHYPPQPQYAPRPPPQHYPAKPTYGARPPPAHYRSKPPAPYNPNTSYYPPQRPRPQVAQQQSQQIHVQVGNTVIKVGNNQVVRM